MLIVRSTTWKSVRGIIAGTAFIAGSLAGYQLARDLTEAPTAWCGQGGCLSLDWRVVAAQVMDEPRYETEIDPLTVTSLFASQLRGLKADDKAMAEFLRVAMATDERFAKIATSIAVVDFRGSTIVSDPSLIKEYARAYWDGKPAQFWSSMAFHEWGFDGASDTERQLLAQYAQQHEFRGRARLIASQQDYDALARLEQAMPEDAVLRTTVGLDLVMNAAKFSHLSESDYLDRLLQSPIDEFRQAATDVRQFLRRVQ